MHCMGVCVCVCMIVGGIMGGKMLVSHKDVDDVVVVIYYETLHCIYVVYGFI